MQKENLTPLTAPMPLSVRAFAELHAANPRRVWLSLEAYRGSRDRLTTRIQIAAATPCLLRSDDTGEVVRDKDVIRATLGLPARSGDMFVSCRQVPEGKTLFVLFDKSGRGRKIIRPNTPVICSDRTPSTAVGVKSARDAASCCSDVTQEDLAAGSALVARGFLETRARRQHETEFPTVITAELEKRRSRYMRLDRSLYHAYRTVRKRTAEPPLHFAFSDEATNILAGGVSWHRPDPRVLTRVVANQGATLATAASRKVLFILLSGTVVHPVTATATDALALRLSPDGCARFRDVCAERIRQGYRVVFFEHLPWLHHSSAGVIDAELANLFASLQELCGDALSASAVLSAASAIQAVGDYRGLSTMSFPNSGLAQVFHTKLNSSMTNFADSAFVGLAGVSASTNPFLAYVHKRVAQNVGSTLIDLETEFLQTPATA